MKKLFLFPLAATALLMSCKSGNNNNNDATADKTIEITFESKSGSNVQGSATFVESNGEVTLSASLTGLEPGIHAIHIHEKSDCSDPKAENAGGHWNPGKTQHGKWGEGEYHKGDIGNFAADENGNGAVSFSTDEWCIGCGDPMRDITGKSLIVHAQADDYVTQPTGNAGGRMACSAIIE